MNEVNVDILIVGGGLTGAALLLAVKNLGYSCLLVEATSLTKKAQPDFDARSLALSPASQKILQTLEVWPDLKAHACPIQHIHVSDKAHFGAARLNGEPQNPLGYVIEINYIQAALNRHLQPQQYLSPSRLIALDATRSQATVIVAEEEKRINAKLIVAADGANSALRRICQLPVDIKNYHQHAIVANVALARPHHFKAYERFTPHGPLALLPLNDQRMALVWAGLPEKINQLIKMDESDFLKALQDAFGYRVGKFIKVGQRSAYPLMQAIMPKQTLWPVVFVGNAAHTLHPIAGQGFNLGLRDVAMLAECIAKKGLSPQMLDAYAQTRKHDQKAISLLTDGLIHLFTSRLPGIALLRNLGLIALDNSPILKGLLSHYARGYGGITPELVCGIPVHAQIAEN